MAGLSPFRTCFISPVNGYTKPSDLPCLELLAVMVLDFIYDNSMSTGDQGYRRWMKDGSLGVMGGGEAMGICSDIRINCGYEA